MSNSKDWIRSEWVNAQAGCIGCVLQSPELAGQLLSETSAEDFDGGAKTVYQAISTLFTEGQSPDPVQVGERTNGVYNEYLLQCVDIVPTTLSLPQYIASVKRQSRMAQLQSLFLQAAAAPTLDAMGDYLSQANALMVTSRKNRVYDMTTLLLNFYERKQKGETYLPSGLKVLDSVMYISPGDYNVLAGQPSRGKTALALQMALIQARQYHVGFYSLETNKGKITDRLMTHYSHINMKKIKLADLDEDDWARAADASSALSTHYNFDVVEAAGMTVDDIFHTALSRRHEIIYIDYLQIIAGTGKSRTEIVTNISARIHQLSQRHKILVVALSQLSRETSKLASEEPNMNDLRESGQIEQDADSVLMIYCQKKNDTKGPRVLKIAKNKEGQTCKIDLDWDGNTQTFTPLSRHTPPPLPKTLKELPYDTTIPAAWEQTSIAPSF